MKEEEQLYNYIDKIRDLIDEKLIDNKTAKNKLTLLALVLAAILLVAMFLDYKYNNFIDSYIKIIIFLIGVMIIYTLFFLITVKENLTTVSGFIGISLFTTFILGILLITLFLPMIKNYFVSYLILMLVFTIVWAFLSCLCNSDVAIISNAIVAFIISILLGLNSFIWKVLEVESVNINCINSEKLIGMDVYQTTELLFNIIIFPIFFMVAFEALICAHKKYVKEKHK